MSAVADLAENRVVDGVYAVLKKEKLRTRGGAPYLALELADATGRISGRVWSDVELLDARFAEGDAVHVLGRVEKFRDKLQLEVRALEPAEADPATLAPALRRDAEELEGFLAFLASEIHDDGLRELVTRVLADTPLRAYPGDAGRPPLVRGRLARAHGRRRDDLPRARAAAPAPARRPAARRGARARRRPYARARPASAFRPTEEGRLLGHVHLGVRVLEAEAALPPSWLHAVATHHDVRAARTAEAAALYHANQLDAVAATRPAQ